MTFYFLMVGWDPVTGRGNFFVGGQTAQCILYEESGTAMRM